MKKAISGFAPRCSTARRAAYTKRIAPHFKLAPVAAVVLAMFGTAYAADAPLGGQVVSGSGSIVQAGHTTTINQNTQKLSINWHSFDIGKNYTVDFKQPNASALAVNRVTGNTTSRIFGHLNANGQVWLINPNGVIFGKSAQVNVGSIVASTLQPDGTNTNGTVRFSGKGKGNGKVTNLGRITVAPRGYVALLANEVSNAGIITARLGTVAMGAGSTMALTFSGDRLLNSSFGGQTDIYMAYYNGVAKKYVITFYQQVAACGWL
ncbi:MAG TPA: filamentous hemagglutinin N-terminal domain-containing protein [Nevskiaceae bacterium]|nr:filamentous hemagglutinin N-terminal domain-containing protein [Nevskiaceae bacterium]